MGPNPDDELEERLARLKGLDVEQVRHPGKGLETDPLENKEDSLLLHDHSSYTIVNSGEEHEEGLAKEIFEINKELALMRKNKVDAAAKKVNVADSSSDEDAVADAIASLKLEDHDPD